jgi:mono/diheme cytochrome c family protein
VQSLPAVARRLAAAAALALLAAGCAGERHAAVEHPQARASGAAVFSSAGCGGCHTLAAARSNGTRGPNLDQLKPDAALVARQVRIGGNGMPSFAGRLSTTQIQQVAAYVARSAKATPLVAQSFGAIAADFEPDGRTVDSCGHDWRCYEQAFGDLAYYHGARSALREFARDIPLIPEVRQDCHLISHAIGAGAYVRYRDPGKAFVAAGSLAMTCSSGFYHGVLQRALHGVDATQIARVARTVCASRAASSTPFVHSQCVHGLGHGLLIYTAYDLPRALRTCDSLPVRVDQQTCTGGVFMENFTTSLGIRSPWLRQKDPIFPCDAVAEKDKLYCYLILTAHLLDVTDGSWRQTIAWCRKAEPAWVTTCFESLGRDISGRTLQVPRAVLRLCALAGDMQGHCVYGAVRDVTAMDAGAGRAVKLCRLAPDELTAGCYRGIGAVLGTLSQTPASRRASCRTAVAQRWWTACFRGAGALAAPAA